MFSPEELQGFMETFVLASSQERQNLRLTLCPPHVRKNWQLGLARQERIEQLRHKPATVMTSIKKVKFVFEELPSWARTICADMDAEQEALAKTM